MCGTCEGGGGGEKERGGGRRREEVECGEFIANIYDDSLVPRFLHASDKNLGGAWE